jgi:hypothetical protein
MTLQAWVRPTARKNAWRGVVTRKRSGGNGYGLYASDDRGRVASRVSAGGTTRTAIAAQLPRGRWSHLATTYDGSTLRVFVNGALKSSQPATGAMDAGAVRIGDGFTGSIDDVRLSRAALSAAAIQADVGIGVR